MLRLPTGRGKGNKEKLPDELQDKSPFERRASMTWAQRLKRVFNIDIEICRECGGESPRVCRRVYFLRG